MTFMWSPSSVEIFNQKFDLPMQPGTILRCALVDDFLGYDPKVISVSLNSLNLPSVASETIIIKSSKLNLTCNIKLAWIKQVH